MDKIPARTSRNGYTLVELLLYVSIIGSMLVAITLFFGTIMDARVKGQSIAEVESQGTAIMDTITQTIRNASSITTPASGATATSLTLVVPTASLSPTVFSTNATNLGYTTDGGTTSTSNSNQLTATKFTASATGTISMLYAHLGPTVAASPNNVGQMAIYSGTSNPGTLLASSASTKLTPSNWNAFSINTVNVTSGQTYWLVFNTNGLASTDNDLRNHTGTAGQAQTLAQTYGTWPASFTGTAAATEYSVFAPIETSTPAALQITEGAGAATALSGDNIQVTGLTVKNLTRSGTTGLVQVSFTVSRYNPGDRNEFEYRRTFTSTAEVGW